MNFTIKIERRETVGLICLEALDHLAPGINSRHTLLYGVEVKFYPPHLRHYYFGSIYGFLGVGTFWGK
jgi:hypothetical protein